MRPPAAFTLVELLVVIGIIAVLISILLPVLGVARERGNTIKCLSNLRQLAVAAAVYTATNRGVQLPSEVFDDRFAANTHQGIHESWATILVADKLVPYPEFGVTTVPPAADTVFRCPSGVLDASANTTGSTTIPASRTDRQGAMANVSASMRLNPGTAVYIWYGVNGTNGVIPAPYYRCTIDVNGKATGLLKQNAVRHPTEFVFLFDGLLGVNYSSTNANRINARHMNRKYTNCAFVDGHAESVKTTSIPGGDKDAQPGLVTFALANCVNYPHPKWRLDHN